MEHSSIEWCTQKTNLVNVIQIHQKYPLRTVHHSTELYSMYSDLLYSSILYSSILHSLNIEFYPKIIRFLTMEGFRKHYNCKCILLSPPWRNMSMSTAQQNYIHTAKSICWSFLKYLIHLINARNMEYINLKIIFSNPKPGRSWAQMAFTVMNG